MGQRPTYEQKRHCERVVYLMAQGYTPDEVAADFEIQLKTMHVWAREHPEFKEALMRGASKCKAWWLKKGRDNLENPKFLANHWGKFMLNLFDWKTDKSESNTTIVSHDTHVFDTMESIRQRMIARDEARALPPGGTHDDAGQEERDGANDGGAGWVVQDSDPIAGSSGNGFGSPHGNGDADIDDVWSG